MKTTFFTLTALMCVLSISSCSKGDENKEIMNNTLVGTTWECVENSDLHTFDFNSITSCKYTTISKELDNDFNWINVTSYRYYTYTVSDKTVTLIPSKEDMLVPLVGTINGNIMSIVNTSTDDVIYTCTKIK